MFKFRPCATGDEFWVEKVQYAPHKDSLFVGMRILHQYNFVHGNLRHPNILAIMKNNQYYIMIIDFD
jgi:tRNA A-37 threonylcarbamoyl transferase component Bud32